MKIKKNIKKVIILTIFLILVINVNVSAEVCISFEENINNLEGTMTVEDSKRFINNDKLYLNGFPNKSDIKKEIEILETNIKIVKEEYELVKGIKIYKGNTGLKNNSIRTAIKNRKSYINNKEIFSYDDKTIYNMDREYNKEPGINRYFNQKEMDMTYEAIVEVIESIELDLDFLNDTTFVVSPFILDGMNGYTVTRSNGHSTIVISNHVYGVPDDWLKESTKSTILHEVGHVFQNENEKKFEKNKVANNYLLQSDKDLQVDKELASKEEQEWKTSVNENFAEDFRIHFSTRLGDNSFEPLAKKTLAEYDSSEFSEVILALTK